MLHYLSDKARDFLGTPYTLVNSIDLMYNMNPDKFDKSGDAALD
eukprot:gene45104-1168_t